MKIGRKKIIRTKSGSLETPFFMPDATRGFVKSLGKEDLEKIGAGPMVVNTYHLYLQPGIELIKKAARFDEPKARRGGISKFMNWPHPLLSDSGGYQIFSLIHKNPEMGKITDDEVIFKSPLDGSRHILTPEKAIQIQFDLEVDMMVALDDPPPNNYPKEKIEEAVSRTIKWAKRCKEEYSRQLEARRGKLEMKPLLFGVIQGGTHKDLRKHCAEELIKIGFDGLGFGARHHDEEGSLMEELLKFTANLIPENYLRFALGVGTPEDMVKCAGMGWDMFDCVIPTREGRHGRLFLWKEQPEFPISPLRPRSEASKSQFPNKSQIPKSKLQITNYELQDSFYETLNINNEKYKEDFSPVDKNCDCELCRNYSRAYLKHLFKSGDPLAMRLAAIHNLRFYLRLFEKLREER